MDTINPHFFLRKCQMLLGSWIGPAAGRWTPGTKCSCQYLKQTVRWKQLLWREGTDGRSHRDVSDTQQHIQADCLPGSCSVLQRTALLQTNTGQFSHHSSCYSTEPEINTSWLKPCFAIPELCIYLAAALPEDGEDQRGVQLSLEDSFSFVFSSFQEHFFCFQWAPAHFSG